MTACPHCPDGHRRADSKPWGARVSDYRDSDGQPVFVIVERPASEHVAESDAEWVRDRLNKTDAQAALDSLEALAGDDRLGGYLPGLSTVVGVLRESIAEAEARRAADADKASYGAVGGAGSPWSITVGEKPTAAEAAERLRAARRKRGIGT